MSDSESGTDDSAAEGLAATDADLASKTVVAVGWVAGARVAQQAVQFGVSILLARLLGPEAFGLIGMVIVFTGFARVFSEFGFGSALVQRHRITESHRSGVFWFTIAMGLVLALVIAAASPLVARFYDEPVLRPITALIGLTFLFSAPAAVPRSLLQKELRFKRIAAVDTVVMVLAATAALSAALAGLGVWSLVIQTMVSSLLLSVGFMVAVSWRPRLEFRWSALKELLRYGAGLTGFQVVNYWARSADNLLVGRFLGAAALGLYSRAYSLMLLPLTQVQNVIAPALFPALSSIQQDRPRVKRVFLRSVMAMTFLTFPMMFGLFAVADPFVRGVLGMDWIGVIPLIQILALGGVLNSLANPTGWIFTSQGKTDLMFRWGVFASVVRVLGFGIGVAIGTVEAVAWSYLIGGVFLTPIVIHLSGGIIGLKVLEVLGSASGNLVLSATMCGLVLALNYGLPPSMDSLARLGVLVPAGVLSYGLLAWWSRARAIDEMIDLMEKMRPGLGDKLRWLQRSARSRP